MVGKQLEFFFLGMCFIIFQTNDAMAQMDKPDPNIAVVMRLIGHSTLLQNGDSTSQVLPIEKLVDRYKISFKHDFSFQPEDLVQNINKIVARTHIAKSYIIEVTRCENNEVVYSYKIGHEVQTDILPCRGRTQPKGCYHIFFTILDNETYNISTWSTTTLAIPFLILVLSIVTMLILWLKNKKSPQSNTDTIPIGQYLFDQKNLVLYLKKDIIVLSGKESDLLFLLYSNANQTVEREIILKEVWGDEGGYVGRTLDVFISKLRKKLINDPQLKIINIRGVGYKFVMNH